MTALKKLREIAEAATKGRLELLSLYQDVIYKNCPVGIVTDELISKERGLLARIEKGLG